MDKSVPAGAAKLLDLIGKTETTGDVAASYNTIFGNRQNRLPKPITSMTLAELQRNQANWGNNAWVRANWGATKSSSASGRYQFMRATLKGLIDELGLNTTTKFSPDLQDRLGYVLLKRRGYELFAAGKISRTEFGKRLAQEWASFPVLQATQGASRRVKRGQSYYAGDGLNHALISPNDVEAALDLVHMSARKEEDDPNLITRPEEVEDDPIRVEDFVDEPTAVERQADPVLPEGLLKAMQRQFHRIGYGAEAGDVDGKWGGKCVAAFSAFQQDNGLPVTGQPDSKTVEMLFAAEPNSRPIKAERQNTTAKELKEKGSEIVESTQSMKGKSLFAIIAGGFWAAYEGVVKFAGDAWDYLKDFRDMFDQVPSTVWVILVVLVAWYFHRQADKAERARVEAEKKGLITTVAANEVKA